MPEYKSIKGQFTGSSTARPKQRLRKSEKTEKWQEDCIDYFGTTSSITAKMRDEMRVLYGLALGRLNERDYTFVVNPLGEEQRKRPELQGDPAKLRNYDIISPAVQRTVGDFTARKPDWKVVAVNSTVEERRQAFLKEELKKQMLIEYQNELNAQGIDTGMEGEAKPIPQVIEDAKHYPDTMTTNGQRAYDYMRFFNEFDRKWRLGLFDYLTVGRVFTYRDVFKNDTVYEIISPIDLDYISSPETEFLEDAESVNVRYWLNASDVLDEFHEELKPEEIDWIERNYGVAHASGGGYYDMADTDVDENWRQSAVDELFNNLFSTRRNDRSDAVEVRHVVWKSQRKLGKLMQWDYFGNELEPIEVDEDFKPRPDEEIEWMWVTEAWEGYKIADRFYKRARRIPVQRGTINNPSGCKLPYNGRVYGARGHIPYTMVKKGKPHQELYNILKYRLERTIAKNKDKMVLFPLGLAPDNDDMDMFSMLYYADYHGFLFYDESDPKKVAAANTIKQIDVGLQQYVRYLHDLLMSIRAEYYEQIGLPRQKLADIKPSDDVGNTQAAIAQGALILEDTMLSFEELIQRDIAALLDLSKYAWSDGKKAQIMSPNNELMMVDIDPYDHQASEYGLFPLTSRMSQQNLEQLKQLAQPFAQNSATPTMVGEILRSNNFDQLMTKLQEMEDELGQRQQAAQQADLAAKQEEDATKKAELDFKYYKTDTDNKTKLEVAAMDAEAAMAKTIGSGQVPSDRVQSFFDRQEELKEAASNTALKREELQLKRDENAVKLKVAKENKNKYDKLTNE